MRLRPFLRRFRSQIASRGPAALLAVALIGTAGGAVYGAQQAANIAPVPTGKPSGPTDAPSDRGGKLRTSSC